MGPGRATTATTTRMEKARERSGRTTTERGERREGTEPDRPAAAIHTYTLCAALHCGNQVLVVDGQTIRRITRARQGPRSYPPDLARNGEEGKGRTKQFMYSFCAPRAAKVM